MAVSNSRRLIVLIVVASLGPLAPAAAAHAQLAASNLKGDWGLRSASQVPPGRYAGVMFPLYNADTIKGSDGNALDTRGSLTTFAVAPLLWVVTDKKILGANYGVLVVPPFVNIGVEAPRLDVEESQFGFGDLYVMPLQLGWHAERFDAQASYAFYAPTGRYDPDADDNLGLGMWSHELAAGATVYLDQARSWHFATMGYYEIHSSKRDIDVTVGDVLTLEGGVGRSFANGAVLGVAYYAQWKVTEDAGADLSLLVPFLAKNHVGAIGPEAVLLQGALSVRGLFEFGARTATQGFTFVATLALPF